MVQNLSTFCFGFFWKFEFRELCEAMLSLLGLLEIKDHIISTYIPWFLDHLLAAVMQTEGFNYLEATCPSLLSDLLATVAVVDDDSSPISRKRSGSSNIGLNLMDSVDLNGRRMKRRM